MVGVGRWHVAHCASPLRAACPVHHVRWKRALLLPALLVPLLRGTLRYTEGSEGGAPACPAEGSVPPPLTPFSPPPGPRSRLCGALPRGPVDHSPRGPAQVPHQCHPLGHGLPQHGCPGRCRPSQEEVTPKPWVPRPLACLPWASPCVTRSTPFLRGGLGLSRSLLRVRSTLLGGVGFCWDDMAVSGPGAPSGLGKPCGGPGGQCLPAGQSWAQSAGEIGVRELMERAGLAQGAGESQEVLEFQARREGPSTSLPVLVSSSCPHWLEKPGQ